MFNHEKPNKQRMHAQANKQKHVESNKMQLKNVAWNRARQIACVIKHNKHAKYAAKKCKVKCDLCILVV